MLAIRVEGMHCNKCVERITKALERDNIKAVVDLEEKTVTLDEDKTRLDDVLEALEDLGFEGIVQ